MSRRPGAGGAPPARLLDRVPAAVLAMSGSALRDAVGRGWCAESFNDAWYPVGERSSGEARAEAARLCGGCTVRAECLELALRTREVHGVWGGTIPYDRTRILQSRAHATRRLGRGRRELARSA